MMPAVDPAPRTPVALPKLPPPPPDPAPAAPAQTTFDAWGAKPYATERIDLASSSYSEGWGPWKHEVTDPAHTLVNGLWVARPRLAATSGWRDGTFVYPTVDTRAGAYDQQFTPQGTSDVMSAVSRLSSHAADDGGVVQALFQASDGLLFSAPVMLRGGEGQTRKVDSRADCPMSPDDFNGRMQGIPMSITVDRSTPGGAALRALVGRGRWIDFRPGSR